jgi:hypothetical protein
MKVRKCRNGLCHSDVANLTEEFGHEGISEEISEMKKSLLATVAAVALIAGAGMASAAEGAKDQLKAGQTEMKKGSDSKAGAEMKGRAETTGAGAGGQAEPRAQGTNDAKSGPSPDSNEVKRDVAPKADSGTKAKPSTTGQASEQKAAPAAKSGADDKAAPAGRSSTNEKAAPAAGSSAQGTQSPAAKSSAQGTQQAPANSAAQGGGQSNTSASVNLTTEQKTKIRTTVLQSSNAPKVSRSQINFNIRVGTVVPRSVRFVEVPPALVEVHPQWRGHRYFVVDDEIIIVDARTLQIVAILEV